MPQKRCKSLQGSVKSAVIRHRADAPVFLSCCSEPMVELELSGRPYYLEAIALVLKCKDLHPFRAATQQSKPTVEPP